MNSEKVSVVGLGKLGAPLAACFASKGFEVIALDADAGKVKALNDGIAPVFEPGLQELIHANRNRLHATQDYEEAILNSDTTFIVVQTPSDKKGGFSLKYVLETGGKIASVLQKKKGYHLIVLTSTVMPGSTEGELKPFLETKSGKECGRDFGLCYSPEFIALGSVIHDFLNPDFLLIGESDTQAGDLLEKFYRKVCGNNPPIARMNFVNAELTKLAVNTYVTTKITFANTLARMCERLQGADADIVSAALGLDSRIGRKYLKGAIGYGGPCFPRDNRALIALANSLGVSAQLAESTDSFNQQQVLWLSEVVKKSLPAHGKVGILGLAYKPQSDVVEDAQGLLLAQNLARNAIPVVAYDPLSLKNAKSVLDNTVAFAVSMEECIRKSDVIVITTPWEEFRQVESFAFDRSNPKVIIDCWRILSEDKLERAVKYIPLGKGPPSPG